ncbi:MFS transporter, partial [Streptomyces brasiliscabiei]|uniref:MFS transporter n=1 Tax=Streptomyces brasiliscabiei TaxID=2736302 RepID=UPI0038F631CF
MKNLTLLGYANGNLGKQILYGTVDLCFLYYLTDILGVSPILAGYILFISLAIDALFDPIV